MKIDEIWQQLEQEGLNLVSGYLNRRVMPELQYDVYLAIERPHNTWLLMLRLHREVLDVQSTLPSSRSFAVRRVEMPRDEQTHVTLQLVLTDRRYRDIFVTLVQDILDYLAAIPTEKQAAKAFIVRLERWQVFLERHGEEGLSSSAQQGLYGELWCLRRLILPNLGLTSGVKAWTGPDGTPQDFHCGHCALEVKTTASKQHQKLAIANERQLDNTASGPIVLMYLSVDARQNQGEFLPELVSELRSQLAAEPLANGYFDNLLFKVGYLDIHTPLYESTGYFIRQVGYFNVEGDFPRIIETDLRSGVGDVRYTVSVSACQNFAVDENFVAAQIRK